MREGINTVRRRYTVYTHCEELGYWIVALSTDELYTARWFTDYMNTQPDTSAEFVGW